MKASFDSDNHSLYVQQLFPLNVQLKYTKSLTTHKSEKLRTLLKSFPFFALAAGNLFRSFAGIKIGVVLSIILPSFYPFLFINYIQALLTAEINQRKCAETMKFLLSRQKPDGSFKNLGATIYVLPSLVGALPYDVNKITCPVNKTGEEIFYHER